MLKRDHEFSTLADRVVKGIKIPYVLQGKDYYVSASIGVAVYPDHGCSEEQLLKNADAAMYEVKKNGKNGFQFFTNELDDQVLMRIELERDLRKAVKNDELVLYYQQPQIQTGINQLSQSVLSSVPPTQSRRLYSTNSGRERTRTAVLGIRNNGKHDDGRRTFHRNFKGIE
ncbi:diguanylate cyclase (GGDEF)-like protein [Brevibacillus brevis]|nr:diguanylate cyclase (GGDEF)-like protein [Brevibacillus brevis]GEC89311.1 hypothetical protein BBR01nite_16420 [Brevibacillus brevis]VEF89121.1 Cyclic di-GMP phosphodiesterase Gmr [Brevibacillus brevis]